MKLILIICSALIILGGGILIYRNQSLKPSYTPSQTSLPTFVQTPQEINITASFEIITDNQTRNFSNPKYHHKSTDVYIEASNPDTVHVKKIGITWDDFFKTLPMKLTKECLTTGDGKTFCDEKDGTLKFYLNDVEDKNLLDKEIKQGDSILIKFTLS